MVGGKATARTCFQAPNDPLTPLPISTSQVSVNGLSFLLHDSQKRKRAGCTSIAVGMEPRPPRRQVFFHFSHATGFFTLVFISNAEILFLFQNGRPDDSQTRYRSDLYSLFPLSLSDSFSPSHSLATALGFLNQANREEPESHLQVRYRSADSSLLNSSDKNLTSQKLSHNWLQIPYKTLSARSQTPDSEIFFKIEEARNK